MMLHRGTERGTQDRLKAAAVGGVSVVAALLLSACGSSNSSGHTPAAAPSTASNPTSANQGAASGSSGPAVVETNPPGDIPDNQAFVPYAGSGFTVMIPEGWARSTSGMSTVYSDKYNNITITAAAAAQAPTIASARAVDLPAIQASSTGFAPGAVTTVRRTAGTAIEITYHAQSAVNSVTGKVANEAVERYVFWRGGTAVTLTLAAPVGSDNVDPWRKVTDSFRWTR